MYIYIYIYIYILLNTKSFIANPLLAQVTLYHYKTSKQRVQSGCLPPT